MSEARTPWRFWGGFSQAEVWAELQKCTARLVTVPSDPDAMSDAAGWNRYYSRAAVAREAPGAVQADGGFAKAQKLTSGYAFSDPRIVRGHFDETLPLLGRTMVLEVRAFGLRYLCGVRVTRVRETTDARRTVFAFRYDTLQGHIERGAEWFVLTKDHGTGFVEFRIEASWRPGVFPNWWSRVGFSWVGPRFQRAWHRLAYLRLRSLLEAQGLPPVPRGRNIMHPGVPVDAPSVGLVAGAPSLPQLAEHEVPEAGA